MEWHTEHRRSVRRARPERYGFCALALAASPFFSGPVQLWIVFTAAIVLGCMHAFSPAAASALLPRIVPRADLRQAIAWNSLGFPGRPLASLGFPERP